MLRTLRRITQAPAVSRTRTQEDAYHPQEEQPTLPAPPEEQPTFPVPPEEKPLSSDTASDHDAGDQTLYFMDSPTEGGRLELKTDPYLVGNQLLAAGLRHDMRALDVACGSGAVTRVMAQIAGNGRVTGVDASAARVEEARQRAAAAGCDIQFVKGVGHALPFADHEFAFTHARMVFQYLPDPLRVLAEMKRVTQPGGRVVVIDLDGQIEGLYPLPADVRDDLDAALVILRATGFDPHVGRKMFGYFHSLELRQIRTVVEPYQLYAGGELSPRDRANWHEKLDTATRFLARATGDVARWTRFRDAYLACLEASNSFYLSTMMIVSGIVPSAS